MKQASERASRKKFLAVAFSVPLWLWLIDWLDCMDVCAVFFFYSIFFCRRSTLFLLHTLMRFNSIFFIYRPKNYCTYTQKCHIFCAHWNSKWSSFVSNISFLFCFVSSVRLLAASLLLFFFAFGFILTSFYIGLDLRIDFSRLLLRSLCFVLLSVVQFQLGSIVVFFSSTNGLVISER